MSHTTGRGLFYVLIPYSLAQEPQPNRDFTRAWEKESVISKKCSGVKSIFLGKKLPSCFNVKFFITVLSYVNYADIRLKKKGVPNQRIRKQRVW